MTETKVTKTMAGNAVAEHECSGIDCYPCLKADQDAATARIEANRTKKFEAKKVRRGRSVTASAKTVAARTVSHEAGTVEGPRYFEYSKNGHTVRLTVRSNGTAYVENGIEDGAQGMETTAAVAWSAITAFRDEPGMTGGEVKEFTVAQKAVAFAAAKTEDTPGVGPAHLSDVTRAKGFMLAGNARVTFRSRKTGTRYTYQIQRGKCSRCGKTDCGCWAHPNFFVKVLTGPDNTEDYQYLGMIRENNFRATKATGSREASAMFKAFRYVWERLVLGQYPENVEIWHEGRCGRCGRVLTVPESIAAGIGPDCASKM